MSKNASTAWALLVVSDPGQADTLVDQRAWAEEAARASGWTLTKIWEGVSSGRLGARGLTLDLIGELERLTPAQRPQRLLMIRLERLGRGDGTEAMEAFLRIRKLDIVIHTRLDGDVSYGRASELLMPVLRLFVGALENEVRRDKLCSMYGRRRAARKTDPWVAISMRAPYGLMYQDGRMVPNPPEDVAVRLAYQLKAQGYGYYLVAKRLTGMAPPMVLKCGKRLVQHWTADRVRKLIKNETYRQTLIDETTWLRAQQPAKEIHRPTRRHEYPLGGALRCVCGSRLVGIIRTWKGAPSCRYYSCRVPHAHGGHMKFHRSEALERQFVALLESLTADRPLLERYAETKQIRGHAEALDSQLAALRRELGGIADRRRLVFSAYEDGVLKRDDLRWRLDDLENRERELGAKIDQVDRERQLTVAKRFRLKDLSALLTSAAAHWVQAPIDDRRALAKALANAFGGFVVSLTGELQIASAELPEPRSV